MLHAAVLQTMWEERSRTRSGVEARDVSVLWQLTKRRFARDAQDHIRHVMLQREYLDEDALMVVRKNVYQKLSARLYVFCDVEVRNLG